MPRSTCCWLRRDLPLNPEAMVAVLTTPATVEVDLEADRVRGRAPGPQRGPPGAAREQAAAVVMSVFYGLTAGEIATKEKIPLGMANTRIRNGLGRLRDRLGVDNG